MAEQKTDFFTVREGFVFPSTDARGNRRDYLPGDSIELAISEGEADHRLERAVSQTDKAKG